MPRSEYIANEALASSPKAKHYARVNYVPARNVGPVEIIVKLTAFVLVFVAIGFLLAH